MSKKLILVLMAVIFFSKFSLVFAGVVISEVKLLPIEDRFIKLYNQDNFDVDLTNWYIQRKTQNGAKFDSLVTSTFFKDKVIKAGSYFLISRSSTESSDIILDNLTLTESNAIQIKNLNEEVVDKVCWGEITECGSTLISNPVSGQSIKFAIQTFVTPSPVNNVSSGSTGTSTGSANTEGPKPKTVEIPKIKTQIIAKVLGFVDSPISFDAVTLGLNGELLHSGKYFWNFGDGDSKEMQLTNSSQKFSHTYFYPGDYTVSLDYYQNYYSNTPDASTQIIVKIIGADISISRVGDEKDFFVELSNNTDYTADLSNWFLVSAEKSFTIPRNTILAAKKKMIISPRITNFGVADKSTLKLMNEEGEVVFDLASSVVLIAPVNSQVSSSKKVVSPNISSIVEPIQTALALNTQTPVENPSDTTKSTSNNAYLPIIFSVIFIGSSASAVYFIRQKKVSGEEGNDFEILDE